MRLLDIIKIITFGILLLGCSIAFMILSYLFVPIIITAFCLIVAYTIVMYKEGKLD